MYQVLLRNVSVYSDDSDEVINRGDVTVDVHTDSIAQGYIEVTSPVSIHPSDADDDRDESLDLQYEGLAQQLGYGVRELDERDTQTMWLWVSPLKLS